MDHRFLWSVQAALPPLEIGAFRPGSQSEEDVGLQTMGYRFSGCRAVEATLCRPGRFGAFVGRTPGGRACDPQVANGLHSCELSRTMVHRFSWSVGATLSPYGGFAVRLPVPEPSRCAENYESIRLRVIYIRWDTKRLMENTGMDNTRRRFLQLSAGLAAASAIDAASAAPSLPTVRIGQHGRFTRMILGPRTRSTAIRTPHATSIST